VLSSEVKFHHLKPITAVLSARRGDDLPGLTRTSCLLLCWSAVGVLPRFQIRTAGSLVCCARSASLILLSFCNHIMRREKACLSFHSAQNRVPLRTDPSPLHFELEKEYVRLMSQQVKNLTTSVFVQLYYELEEERERLGAQDVALVRVEQLCPFPYDLFLRELNRYPSKSFGAILVLALCSSTNG
jgi:hypothetical protein